MSRSRQKGTAAESAVVRVLREEGFPHAERRSLNGARDRGDIAGLPGVVIEVKAEKTMALAEYVGELHTEMAHDRADFGAVWHKRRGKGDPRDWYVTMDGRMFLELLRAAMEV